MSIKNVRLECELNYRNFKDICYSGEYNKDGSWYLDGNEENTRSIWISNSERGKLWWLIINNMYLIQFMWYFYSFENMIDNKITFY